MSRAKQPSPHEFDGDIPDLSTPEWQEQFKNAKLQRGQVSNVVRKRLEATVFWVATACCGKQSRPNRRAFSTQTGPWTLDRGRSAMRDFADTCRMSAKLLERLTRRPDQTVFYRRARKRASGKRTDRPGWVV